MMGKIRTALVIGGAVALGAIALEGIVRDYILRKEKADSSFTEVYEGPKYLIRPFKYEVMPGDTLGAIAEKIYWENTQWRSMAAENKLTDINPEDPDALKSGQKLTIWITENRADELRKKYPGIKLSE